MGTSSSGCIGIVTIAAIFSLIFAVIWTILAIMGFMLKHCTIKLDDNDPASILVFVYFYDECNAFSWVSSIPFDVSPTTSSRTTGVLWWYAVSGSVRAAAALTALVVIAVCRGRSNQRSSRPSPFLWLWAAVAVAGLIGDLVCAVIYGIDIGHTKSLEDLTGIENLDNYLGPILHLMMAVKILPALMMLFCSRFVVLWILDLCLAILAIRSLTVQQQKSKLPTLDEFEPWQSRLTNAKGVDHPRAGDREARERREGSPIKLDANFYDEPFHISASEMQRSGGQDVQDRGPGECGLNGAYMANPVPGVGPYQLQVPSDVYAQPWAGGRPSRSPPHPQRATGAGRQQHASNTESPSPKGRLGDWDPRSPMPFNNQQSFFSSGGPQQHLQPWQQQRPSELTSFQHQHASEDSARNSRFVPGVRRTDSKEAVRYIQKLRDVEAERLAKDEERKERQRQKDDERREQEQLYADAALLEVAAIASAMEERRRKKRDAEGGSNVQRPKKGPPPAPPRRPPPEGLQNQAPWSYVRPALDDPTVLPMQNRRDDDDDEDAPSVPVPDYTIHIKRHNDRPTIDVN